MSHLSHISNTLQNVFLWNPIVLSFIHSSLEIPNWSFGRRNLNIFSSRFLCNSLKTPLELGVTIFLL
jgi:hypothetical protein